MKKTKSLLDLLVRLRTYKVLDRAAEKNRYYRTTLKEQDKAYDELDKAGLSREQKRITVTEKAVDNEKYAFRCFLLRLGFIGDEYKVDRKILLRNLKGSSAFKNGAKKEADPDEISE